MRADDLGPYRDPAHSESRRAPLAAGDLSKLAARRPAGPTLSSFRRMPRLSGSDFRRRPAWLSIDAQVL